MKSFFATHNKALKAEWGKLHHSGMIWLCLGAAAFIPILSGLIGSFGPMGDPSPDRWNQFIEMNFQIFTGFFFPLFVVIMMVRLVYLEHRSDTWKLIETQPVSKAAIYFSKWEIAAFISLSCLLAMLLFAIFSGWILTLVRPSLGFDQGSIDWGRALQALTRYWIASLCIISIQYFFSLLIKSFAWPMSIGLIGIIAGSIIAQFGYMNWWPYSATQFTSRAYGGPLNGQFLLSHEKISLLSSLLLIWLGYQLYRRKSFKNAFISPFRNLALAAGVITVFALIIWTVDKPTMLTKYSATVLAGEIESAALVTDVALLRPPMMDTILLIPVVKNRFHLRTDMVITPGIYFLKAGTQQAQVFMGTKDSLYLDIEFKEQRSSLKVSGTRTAENDYLNRGEGTNLDFLKQLAERQTPSEFARMVTDYHKEGIHKLETFKTSDRIKPADDFIEMRKKLFTMQALSLLDGYYPRIHAAYFPNQDLKYPRSIERLRASAPMNAPELVSFMEYRKYVTSSLREKAGMDDNLYFAMLRDSLPDPYTRDVILYEAVSDALSKMKDSTQRNMIVAGLLQNIQTEKVRAKLIESNQQANRLMGGMQAYDFNAVALNGKEIRLSSFAGRYVVIDFWTTKCEPCKKETPYFAAHAERFTSHDVAFISLSADEEKNAWESEAKLRKDKKVLQLLAKEVDEKMTEAFALKDLPRYILIDPKGNIINAQLPLPSDPEFESLILKAIPTQSRYQ